jgi:hypothetical protein
MTRQDFSFYLWRRSSGVEKGKEGRKEGRKEGIEGVWST